MAHESHGTVCAARQATTAVPCCLLSARAVGLCAAGRVRAGNNTAVCVQQGGTSVAGGKTSGLYEGLRMNPPWCPRGGEVYAALGALLPLTC